jgi:putative transposase
VLAARAWSTAFAVSRSTVITVPAHFCQSECSSSTPLQWRMMCTLCRHRHNAHLLRNSFRYASRKDWAQIAKDLKPVYTAPSEQAALDRFAEFSDTWEQRYPAIVRLWTNAWPEFVPFLQFDQEIRTIICTTNAIESINARIRRAVNARGHFPNEQAALKCVYLAIMSLDPTGTGRRRWSNRWKKALNAFEITFDGRLSAGRK